MILRRCQTISADLPNINNIISRELVSPIMAPKRGSILKPRSDQERWEWVHSLDEPLTQEIILQKHIHQSYGIDANRCEKGSCRYYVNPVRPISIFDGTYPMRVIFGVTLTAWGWEFPVVVLFSISKQAGFIGRGAYVGSTLMILKLFISHGMLYEPSVVVTRTHLIYFSAILENSQKV